jgi:hypothetical protein
MLLLFDVYSVLEREVGGGVSFFDPDKLSDPINHDPLSSTLEDRFAK